MIDANIIKSLQAVGTLQLGEKMSTRHGVITKDAVPSPLTRWFSGDNRTTTLIAVSDVLDVAFTSLNPIISNLITHVPAGLENLKLTYKGDEATSKTIDSLLDQIKNYMC
jgi:hypothetical protein